MPASSEPLPTRDLENDETVRIARDLIRFDTTNWGEGRSNGEADAAEYLEAELRRLGLEPRVFEAEPGRVSVVTRIEGEGPHGGGRGGWRPALSRWPSAWPASAGSAPGGRSGPWRRWPDPSQPPPPRRGR